MSQSLSKLDEAVRIRERGDPRGALEAFAELLENAESEEDTISLIFQIGLCYEHLSEYDKSATLYDEGLLRAEKLGSLYLRILAIRHKVSLFLEQRKNHEALILSHSLMTLVDALDFRPANLAWILHGHAKALKQNGSPRDIVAGVALREGKELWYIYRQGVDDLNYWVWFTGWLSDMAYAYAPLGWALYLPAYLIVLFKGLGLRQKQFKKGLGKKRI